MFYALPVETVIEAKQRTRRATFYLFSLLIVLYVLFANLLTISAYLLLRYKARLEGLSDLPTIILYTSLTAALIAVLHFLIARAKTLDSLLEKIGAKNADPKDSYHKQFINLVEEAEAATGIHGIRAVVIPTQGCNAFSLQDGKARSAIGATEGILSKLSRQELSAVVAHEAAHLVHEDSRLVTTACFLFGVFGQINKVLGELMRNSTGSSRSRGSFSGLVLVLWCISGLGYLVTRLISMAISREREYLADADGVAMCKDPFSMAEGLYKISHRYRGEMPDTYAALFIVNPAESRMDNDEGFVSNLFSNHPPVSQRLSKLLTWAKSDLRTLQLRAEGEEKRETAKEVSASKGAEPGFMAFKDNQWAGPYTPAQMLSMGFMTPSTWVCPAGSQEVSKASDVGVLLPLFEDQVKGAVTKNACPRCKTPFVTVQYEGSDVEQCSFCKGYLLRAGVLERLITREEETFAPEAIQKAKVWRDSQKGPLKDRDSYGAIKCPHCGGPMGKRVHSSLTQVVIDRCSDDKCGAVWCDGGELETIQMLIEDAHKQAV